MTQRHYAAFLIERRGRWLVRRRPADIVNAGLWEFPNVEVAKGRGQLAQIARETVGAVPESLKQVQTVRHTITRYTNTVLVYRGRWPCSTRTHPRAGLWLSLTALHQLAFSSAHRKILAWLQQPDQRRRL